MITTCDQPTVMLELVWISWDRRLCTTDLNSLQKIVDLSVSITDASQYCLHSHIAAAKARDMTNP